jgi:cell division protein FtsI/penicillin-binding protein 2
VLLRTEKGSESDLKWPVRRIPIGEDNARKIREGMWNGVNNYGTGRNAAIPGLDICGKTGTVQIVSRNTNEQLREEIEDHSWFTGFASRDNPEIAVAVFIEHGGTGGVAAAPLAKQLFSLYFNKRNGTMVTSASAPDAKLPAAEVSLLKRRTP